MPDTSINKEGKTYDCPGEDRGYPFEEAQGAGDGAC